MQMRRVGRVWEDSLRTNVCAEVGVFAVLVRGLGGLTLGGIWFTPLLCVGAVYLWFLSVLLLRGTGKRVR